MERSDARKRRTEDQARPVDTFRRDQWTHWDPAVRELIREHSARAWDEGHQAAGDWMAAGMDAIADGGDMPAEAVNPYRDAS